MLNTDRFRERKTGSENFFNLIALLIRKEGGQIIEKQDKEELRRTSYLDTPHFALRQNGFALRLRAEGVDRFQLNLKYRAADRYLSASRDVSSPNGKKIKFEEDILPPFVSKFSHSNTVESQSMPEIKTIGNVTALFPGLKFLELDDHEPVETANDFTALEIVRKLCKFQFGDGNAIKASLSFWYLETDQDFPLVGEFSFNYEGVAENEQSLEDYPAGQAEAANRFFRALQNHAGWLDLNLQTKTAFALEVL
jgi:hypothetical protein